MLGLPLGQSRTPKAQGPGHVGFGTRRTVVWTDGPDLTFSALSAHLSPEFNQWVCTDALCSIPGLWWRTLISGSQ